MRFEQSNYPIIGKYKEGELIHYIINEKEKKIGTIIEIKKVNFEIETYTIKNYNTSEEIKVKVIRNIFSTEGRFEKIWFRDLISPKNTLLIQYKEKVDVNKVTLFFLINEYQFKNFFLYQIQFKQNLQTHLSGYLFSAFPHKSNLKCQIEHEKISYSLNSKILPEIIYLTELIELLNENKIEYNIDEIIVNVHPN